MDGPEAYGFGHEAARVVAGSAVATGGYGYFTKATGWKLVVGIATTFGGGVMFYRAAMPAATALIGEAVPDLAAGIAGTMTLGVIYALRKGVEKLDLAAWFERKVS